MRVPVIGEVVVTVEAEDAAGAEDAAMDAADALLAQTPGAERYGEIVELSAIREVVRGNVFYGSLASIDVEET